MTKEVGISKETAEVAYKRFALFLEKYHKEQMQKSKVLTWPTSNKDFGLKELCLSVYIQGLSDGHQIKQE